MSNWARTRFDKRKIAWGVGGALVASFPVVLWAHSYGPDPGSSGNPKDPNGTLACATAGCHTTPTGSGPVNAYPGYGVSATFSGGMTYTPGGPAVTITVTVTDPVNKKYGFQMSARTASTDAQAGTFSSAARTANMLIICTDTTFAPQNTTTNGISCPASTPLEFIEHDYAQYQFVGSTPYTFTWTPPATNVGNITFYVAGNAVNGNGLAEAGDHVSTAQYTMTPGAACPLSSKPTVTTINSATDFGGWSNFASGSYLEIKGSNLAPDSRTWLASDFNGN